MPIFAIFAVVAFALALLLDLLNLAGHVIGTITLIGFLLLALHFAVGAAPWSWRRNQ